MSNKLSIALVILFIFSGSLLTREIKCANVSSRLNSKFTLFNNGASLSDSTLSEEISKLNASLKKSILDNDASASMSTIKRLLQIFENSGIDERILSESYYLAGYFYLSKDLLNDARKYLELSIEKNQLNNKIYAMALYNLGVLYSKIGDFESQEEYSQKCLNVEINRFGESSPSLIGTYLSLTSAYINLRDYEESIKYLNIALAIAENNPDSVSSEIMIDLYNNLGAYYNRLADYKKAILYFEKTESIYRNQNLYLDENYINLLNNLAASCGALKLNDESNEYYEKGIALAKNDNSAIAFNFINSYAIFLGNNGNKNKGTSLLKEALDRAKFVFKEDSHNYIEVLKNFADYLREYDLDNNESLKYYTECLAYLNKNQQDLTLRTQVLLGYSLSLAKYGTPDKALEIIQSLLFSDKWRAEGISIYDNPSIDQITSDRSSMMVLKTKYNILLDFYGGNHEIKILEAAGDIAELIVAMLEKVRINISEEESRLVLGDKYRDSYLNSISTFNLLYTQTSNIKFLDKAFEYAEKSKVAGLLTSTRELKASQFHIPEELAKLEKGLQRDIGLFDVRITEENSNANPDTLLLYNLKEDLLKTTRTRDSLVLVFENRYPDYYRIKYNTQVVGFKDIPGIVGRNGNYINYVVSDNLLYVFVANRKNKRLLTIAVDSTLFNNIRTFRSLLTSSSFSGSGREDWQQYHLIGYALYKILFDPVKEFIISDNILISADNILSYLPFETLPTNSAYGERILFREVPYLMLDYNISYTYSATFLAEADRRDLSFGNRVIAFAPNYPATIDIDSVMMNRQGKAEVLSDLPYAREEAEYVRKITRGKSYIGNNAKESVYKAEAGKFDIIHMAMHTILSDKDPMYSTLIFSHENDSIEDSYLRTYEVYGIPLRAKMVVLSSCNTGAGILSSGEGILSLARGFTYSGSQSVVMSMWEIDDRSGTEIIQRFYENLKKGYSKSVALKKARINYLKTAEQLKSHPYFWAPLVIYGNNDSLYYSRYLKVGLGAALLMIIGIILYVRKRKYS